LSEQTILIASSTFRLWFRLGWLGCVRDKCWVKVGDEAGVGVMVRAVFGLQLQLLLFFDGVGIRLRKHECTAVGAKLKSCSLSYKQY